MQPPRVVVPPASNVTDADRPKLPWPDPTPEMLEDPLFEAIWQAIKTWDVNVPGAYGLYMGATGNHARAILDTIRPPGGTKRANAETIDDLRKASRSICETMADALARDLKEKHGTVMTLAAVEDMVLGFQLAWNRGRMQVLRAQLDEEFKRELGVSPL